MKDIFIVSESSDLSNYLFLLLKELATGESFTLSRKFSKNVDLVIIDTETIVPKEVKKYETNAPILLFAYDIKPLLIQYTSNYDIKGVISLTMEMIDWVKTLDSAFNKDLFYSDTMISLLFSDKVNNLVKRVSSLTKRENEIMKMMMRDMTNAEIAKHLKLNIRTVNAHKGNIVKKVKVKTTSGLTKVMMDYSSIFKNL